MKKWFRYIFLTTILMIIGYSGVSAATKIWSEADGTPSSWTSKANEGYVYPYGIVKYDDKFSDSISTFKDNDVNADYYLYYYMTGASNESDLYYTKLNKKVKDSKGNTIYYGDPNDSEYAAFLNFMSDLAYSNGKYKNITPILVVPKDGGTPVAHYIDGGSDRNKWSSTLKKWSSATDYTSDLTKSWNGLVHKYEDKTELKCDPNKDNNCIDDAGESVKKQGEKEQTIGEQYIESDGLANMTLTCDDASETIKLLKQVYRLLRYLIPVLIIGLSIVDFIKVVANGEDKVFKEAWSKFVKRLIIGIVILLVPVLLGFIIKLSGVINAYGIDENNIFCIFS